MGNNINIMKVLIALCLIGIALGNHNHSKFHSKNKKNPVYTPIELPNNEKYVWPDHKYTSLIPETVADIKSAPKTIETPTVPADTDPTRPLGDTSSPAFMTTIIPQTSTTVKRDFTIPMDNAASYGLRSLDKKMVYDTPQFDDTFNYKAQGKQAMMLADQASFNYNKDMQKQAAEMSSNLINMVKNPENRGYVILNKQYESNPQGPEESWNPRFKNAKDNTATKDKE